MLLVTVDTLRADYLACSGHPWIKTPNLDRIARDEIQNLVFFRLYGAWLGRTMGIGASSEIRGQVVTDRATRWLERRTRKPFFAWLHYFDPHAPYNAPRPFRGMYPGQGDDLEVRYAEDVSYADAQFGRFVNTLEEKGLYDDTLIIVTSDHGEAFGEPHDDIIEFGHTYYLYDTTQRVPLLIKPAHSRNTQRRVTEQVELLDIAPTILSVLEMDIPADFVGESLADALEGRLLAPEGRDALAFSIVETTVSDSGTAHLAYVPQVAVRSAEWKYIWIPRTDRTELYDLIPDSQERTNVAATHPDISAQRQARAVPFLESAQQVQEDPGRKVAPEFLDKLKSLGYLGGTDEEEDEETDHPP